MLQLKTDTMLLLQELLDMKVTYQKSIWTGVAFETTIGAVLKDIKTGKYKVAIEHLREQLNTGNIKYYISHKKKLPAVTFSATFNGRRTRKNVKHYNALLVIDIDQLDAAQLKTTFEDLKKDDYVIAFWRSPSNRGYKGLIAIEYPVTHAEITIDTLHKTAFAKVAAYFLTKYNIALDTNGNDITRLCFLSYDKDLLLKPQANKFVVTEEDVLNFSKFQS